MGFHACELCSFQVVSVYPILANCRRIYDRVLAEIFMDDTGTDMMNLLDATSAIYLPIDLPTSVEVLGSKRSARIVSTTAEQLCLVIGCKQALLYYQVGRRQFVIVRIKMRWEKSPSA